ncbi:MAG: protease inhibitor I42 family protein [Methanomassiliicoccales archaeon]|jgi:predicted secreted protein
MHLRAKDSGRSIRVKPKDKIDLELVENLTTGFGWQMVQLPAFLELVDNDHVPEALPLCGSGGTRMWHFNVVGSGSGAFMLEYRRSWEKDVGPARTFEVSLESA